MKPGVRDVLLIVLACLIVYGASLTYGFVWDDAWLIVENPQLKRADILSRAFAGEFFGGQGEFFRIPFYRPLVTLLNAASYFIFGLRPFYYHLTNVVLHTVNAVLLYGLLVLFLRTSPFAALLAALLFAVHPIHTEAVCFVSGRTDLLATSLMLLGLWAYLLKNKSAHTPIAAFHTITLCIFTLGLFSKESFIIFPVLVIAFDYYLSGARSLREFCGQFTCVPGKTRKPSTPLVCPTAQPCLIFYGSLIIVALAYLAARFAALRGLPLPPYPAGTFAATILTMAKVFFHYLALIFLPFNMMVSYENYFAVSHTILEWKVLLALVGIAIYIFLLLASFMKRSRYFLALFWFGVTLLPVMNLFPLGLWLAERFLYLPSIALSFAVAFFLDDLSKKPFNSCPTGSVPLRSSERGRRASTPLKLALLLLIIVYGALAIQRSAIWRSDVALWRDAVRKNPKNAVALTSLAQSLLPLGESAEARRRLEKAFLLEPAKFYPRRTEAYALSLINTGDYDRATSVIVQLRRRMPDSASVPYLRALLALRTGNTDAAERALKESLARNPASLPARVALMNIYIRAGKHFDEVLRLANELASINPDACEGYLYRGVALKNLGRTDEAIQAFEQAISHDPRNPEPYLFLANLYEDLAASASQTGTRQLVNLSTPQQLYLEKALTTYGRLLMRDDRNVSAMLNMGSVYAQLGRDEEAQRLWERILELDPTNAAAQHNLELLRQK
jgi:tetratricopeptide (TPR) repeat protein